MNKLLLLFIPLVLLAGCQSKPLDEDDIDSDIVNIPGDGSKSGDLPVITFENENHNFGTITEGEKVSYAFKFKNTGKKDLVISSAKGSCGCTVADPPAKPIRPGESGFITVTFDSQGRDGFNKKEVVVVSNCQPNSKIITFSVNVVKKEEAK
jgi:hypothetical protein